MADFSDPRVFFAAERTALAWNRTSLTLMAFGFAIERFGMFMRMLVERSVDIRHRGGSFWIGLVFILLGCFFSLISAHQYRGVLKALNPQAIPTGYNTRLAFIINAVVACLSLGLAGYLTFSTQ